MTEFNVQARACEEDTSYYACPNGNFTGCCAHDPCEQGICYDEVKGWEAMGDITKRDVITTTITKLLERDSSSESTITTTKTCTVTVTSTVYNTLTITSASNSLSSLAPVVPDLAALKSVAFAAPSIIKPSPAVVGQSTTKTSTHTSNIVTTTKALIPVSNNATVALRKADPSNAGRVAGITLGSLAGVTLVGILIFLCCRGQRRSRKSDRKAGSTLSVPNTPAIESGGKRKFVFGSRNNKDGDKDEVINRQGDEQIANTNLAEHNSHPPDQQVTDGTFLTRAASRLSQIHPALRSKALPSPIANPSLSSDHDDNTKSHPNPDLLIGSNTSRFYSTANLTRDISTASRMTTRPAPLDLSRTSTKHSKEFNKAPSPITANSNHFTYNPSTLAVPERDRSDTRSINSSISPTPTSMIGPVSSSPVERESIGQALTTPVNVTDQNSPDYILPSQRPGRQVTPSVWTDATPPFTPALFPPPVISSSYTAFRPTLPSSSLTLKSVAETTRPTDNTSFTKRKPIMQIATSGTTTESDMLSPRHQMQEPTRRRKSLFQSPGGMDDDDGETRKKEWI